MECDSDDSKFGGRRFYHCSFWSGIFFNVSSDEDDDDSADFADNAEGEDDYYDGDIFSDSEGELDDYDD